MTRVKPTEFEKWFKSVRFVKPPMITVEYGWAKVGFEAGYRAGKRKARK